MKKLSKKFIIMPIVLICSIVLGIGGKTYMDKQHFYNEMVKVIKSEEVKTVIEEGLKNLDPKALTPEGKIQSYKIDYESIEHNPMGGINGKLYINNSKDLYVTFILDLDSKGNLNKNHGISSYSSKLDVVLKEKYND